MGRRLALDGERGGLEEVFDPADEFGPWDFTVNFDPEVAGFGRRMGSATSRRQGSGSARQSFARPSRSWQRC